VLIEELIRKEKVKLHFHREGVIIGKGASLTDILPWDFSVMGAKSYVPNLSENVRRSLEYKRRNREWGGKAPRYLNQRDGNNKSTPNGHCSCGCYSRNMPRAGLRSAVTLCQ
jgi:hypothetical protein